MKRTELNQKWSEEQGILEMILALKKKQHSIEVVGQGLEINRNQEKVHFATCPYDTGDT